MVNKDKFNKAVEAINAAIDEKDIYLKPCPTCGSPEPAQLNDGYVLLELSRRGDNDARGGKAIATLPFICAKCGHTTLLDAVTLGVGLNIFN